MDSRVMQWLPTAKVAVEYSTRLQPREKALIVTDPTTRDYPASRDLADAVYLAARYVGADVSLIEFPARSRPNEELPDIVAAAMSAADVIYLAATMASFHTQATRRALDKGARVLGIFGGDSAANTVGRGRALDLCPRSVEELEQIARITTALAGMFAHGGTLRATTQKGTDVTCEVGDLEIHNMDALYRGPGAWSHFVPGLTGGGPNWASTQGTLVVDASITPVRRPLTGEQPVVLHIQDGFVRSVEGGLAAAEWKRMGDELGDPNAFAVAEYGFGAHPRARTPVGWPVEDERIYGGFHLGVGTNTAYGGSNRTGWHIDASCLAASAWFNGEPFLADGEFTIAGLR
jgi:leucyl aminopeptidase (aminopeptidase T)